MKRLLACACAAALVSCVPTPDSYPVPPQHGGVLVDPTAGLSSFIKASDASAEMHILKDVRGLEGGAFRWTVAEPEFRFVVRAVDRARLRMNFGVNDVTFEGTGPLTLTFFVNGHELATETYGSPGDKVFDKPVPAAWLQGGAENRVLVRIKNPFVAEDGQKLGFVLHAIGFVN